MTREALEKLNEQQKSYCVALSILIERNRVNDRAYDFERKCGKLRGYLECLADMGVITNAEMKALYLWFFSESRGEQQQVIE